MLESFEIIAGATFGLIHTFLSEQYILTLYPLFTPNQWIGISIFNNN